VGTLVNCGFKPVHLIDAGVKSVKVIGFDRDSIFENLG